MSARQKLSDADQRLNQKSGFNEISAVVEFREGYRSSAGRIDEVREGAMKTLHTCQRSQHPARPGDGFLFGYPRTADTNDERKETKPDPGDRRDLMDRNTIGSHTIPR